VTICCYRRQHLFGNVADGEMVLNEQGEMVKKWWEKLPEKFPEIELGEYQIMPNHFHGIIIHHGAPVGADPCVGPHCLDNKPKIETVENNSAENRMGFPGEHMGSPLHRMIQWFKTMTTNEYIRNVKLNEWDEFDSKLWQRNYYEHIIRNEDSYHRISDYIRNNPAQWQEDEYFSRN